MMKKLLILVLVLGVTSTARAAVSLYVDGSPAPPSLTVPHGSTQVVQVYSDGPGENWGGYFVLDHPASAGALTNPIVLPAAGNLGSMTPYSYAGWGIGYTITAADSQGLVQAGIQFTADWDTTSLAVDDTAMVSLYDGRVSSTVPVDTLLLVIPEPMTIVLLGAGGLLLRRRRK